MSFLESSNILHNKAIHSSKWSLISRISQISGGALVLILLPFWLSPDEIGIIAILTSILAFFQIFLQAGLVEITIQRDEHFELFRNASFFISIIIGFIIFIIIYFFAPKISEYFNNTNIIFPLRVITLQILLLAFINIPLAWMQRLFQYKKIAIINISGSFLMVLISLIFAIKGYGVWSYILGLLIGSCTRLIFVIIFMDWKPKFFFHVTTIVDTWKFSRIVLIEMLIGWFFVWFDNAIVAKNLGNSAVGNYSFAFNISNLVVSIPSSAITGISLPLFSRFQNDLKLLRSIYLKGTTLIALYTIPAGIALSIIGPSLLNVIYPEKWHSIGVILPILSLYSGFSFLWILNTDAFKAIGRPEVMIKIYIPVLLIMIPIYIWSSNIGLIEFTIFRSSIVIIGAFPHTYYAIKYLDLRKKYLIDIVKIPIFASFLMGLFLVLNMIYIFPLLNFSTSFKFIYLIIIILLGATIYTILIFRFGPDFVKKFIMSHLFNIRKSK